jgi:hypothetical protein
MLVTCQNGLSLLIRLIFSRPFIVALLSFRLAYNGWQLQEVGAFQHKYSCGEPNFH